MFQSRPRLSAPRIRLAALIAFLSVFLPAAGAGAYYSGHLTPENPLAGHPWFVDRERGSWWVALRDEPQKAAPLASVAENPMGKTFGAGTDQPAIAVRHYIRRAHASQPGSIPFLNLARLEGKSCPYPPTPPRFSEPEVKDWVSRFSEGIGRSTVLVIIETDRLTTIRCLPRWAQARRFRELRYEVHQLHQHNPNAIVYIDAGAQDWGKKAPMIAGWLRRADVAEARGFAINTSHHDWTWREIRFGLQVSRLLGGKHLVINTNSNGWGPKPHGVSWYSPSYHRGCMPPGEGLGIIPTVKTPDRHIDAFVWSGVPGYEGGPCLGYGPRSPYQFYLELAVSLVAHANPRIR